MVKLPPGSAPARLLRLLRVRLAALVSSALPGRGQPTGHPVTASGARAAASKVANSSAFDLSGPAAPSPASRAAASASRSSSARAAARTRCTARSRSSSIPRRRPSRRRKAPATKSPDSTKSGAAKPAAPPRGNPACSPPAVLSVVQSAAPTTCLVQLLGQLRWLPSPSGVRG